MRHRW